MRTRIDFQLSQQQFITLLQVACCPIGCGHYGQALMAWDPSLLRKYNTTGHFRLLNQLRGELKDQPIQRPLSTSRPEPSRRNPVRRRSEADQPAAAPVRSTPNRVRRQPEPQPQQPAITSFDPIVTVPVLLDAFQELDN